MFGKERKNEKFIYARPSYRQYINIQYYDMPLYNKSKIEIITHDIGDGFLSIMLSNGDHRYIAVSVIKEFTVFNEAINYDEEDE